MDGRLAVCSLAVGIAMFALLWDYLYPFPNSRPILIFCVSSYFILMGILTLYTSFREKSIFLVAVKKDKSGIDPDETVHVSSQMKRFDDIYHLSLSYSIANSRNSATKETKLEQSVALWFDENGVLVYEEFESAVAKLHNDLLSDKKNK